MQMVEFTVSVSSLDDLRQVFADSLRRRAKQDLDKAEKSNNEEADAYRLVAKEFTDESQFWQKLKIEITEKES
jgi:hypothetical protein